MATSAMLPYRIRYASGRDSCTKCGSDIPKGTIQLAIMEQSMTDDCMEPKWYEQECFFKHRRPASETLIDGFTNLRIAHQMEIRKRLGDGISIGSATNSDQPPEKRNCLVQDNSTVLEKDIEKQNKEFFELRGKLKTNTKRDDRIAILTFNKQFVPEGNSEILNHLTDVLYFGALSPCPVCKDGQMVLRNSIYCCTGNVSEWSKCVNMLKTPKRVPAQIPEKYRVFLRGNFKVRTRILIDAPKIADEDYEMHVKQPLFDMEFMIVGETSKPKAEIENQIKQMGGKLCVEFHENLVAIISNAEEVTKMGQTMNDARTHGIPVVPDTFIDEVKHSDPLQSIDKLNLGGWTKNLDKESPQMETNANSIDKPGTSGVPNIKNVKWKYGSVVDPDSKLENVAHVYFSGELKFYAILDFVDIAANKNSYFKMQLLKSDTKHRFWLFVSKGRIATNIGSISITPYNNRSEAVAAFNSLYLEKTGNEFGTKEFVKKPGKYNQMHVEYEIEKDVVLKAGSEIEYSVSTSILSPALFNLIELLFDVDIMEASLIAFDIDLNKMPLGKISKQQIVKAVKLLRGIEEMLLNGNTSLSNRKFVDATNQFYSQIPHNFGVRRPPLLNTMEIIGKKFDMLYAMQQMDITYNLLSETPEAGRNPVDIRYRKLEDTVKIVDLDKQSAEYEEISRYVTNTTQNGPPIELLDVFEVSRREEIQSFAPFEGTTNRKLLWHGSRITNFVGILTNGLEILGHGGTFGKAIYFSDSISKSLHYCRFGAGSENSLLALCEVALGRCHQEEFHRFNINYEAVNHDSVHGVGAFSPESNHVRPDGLIVPNGRLTSRNDRNYLLIFNEFAVYDKSRVKIRYIVKVKP